MKKSQLSKVRHRVVSVLELGFGDCSGACKDVRLICNTSDKVRVQLSKRTAERLSISAKLTGTLEQILEIIMTAVNAHEPADINFSIAVA